MFPTDDNVAFLFAGVTPRKLLWIAALGHTIRHECSPLNVQRMFRMLVHAESAQQPVAPQVAGMFAAVILSSSVLQLRMVTGA
jgi:hypothetical protein